MKLTRRQALARFGQAGLAGLAAAGCATTARASRAIAQPNILFIMSDDHAPHAIGCYGSKINTTPQIDRIAGDGMRFRNCFCTNSICAPSRASILTGKYSHLNGVRDNATAFDGSQQTFPKILRAAGYQTALIGKWHLQSDPTGFDYWNILPGQGAYHDPQFIEMGTKRKHDGYASDLIADSAISFLSGRDTSRPFCLLCQHKAPHRPWEPAAKYANLYEDIAVPVPDTFREDYLKRGTAAREAEMRIDTHLTPDDLKQSPPEGLEGDALAQWKYQRYIKDYLRAVASLDENVGRVLDHLDASGVAQNTLVVYTSDQGFFLGDHGWFDKRFMYEESLRMPLLIRYPDAIAPGVLNDDIVLNVDFAPTFVELAGESTDPAMQGRSIRTLLEGDAPSDWRTSMYYQYYEYPAVHMVRPHYGVRTQRYKLIRFYGDIDEWEFYDLESDPDERVNLYGVSEHAATIDQLKKDLERLRRELAVTDGPPV